MLKKIWYWVILNLHTPKIYKTLARKGIVQKLVDRGLLEEMKNHVYLSDHLKNHKEHAAKYCLHSALLFAKAGRVRTFAKKATPYVIDVTILQRTIMIMLEKDIKLFLKGN